MTFAASAVHVFLVVTAQTMGNARGLSYMSALLWPPLRFVGFCFCLWPRGKQSSTPQSVTGSSLFLPLVPCRLVINNTRQKAHRDEKSDEHVTD